MGKESTCDTNLHGQRLGRKGRITRERIIVAARELIEDSNSEGLSISAVARRSELRFSSIYNYFQDTAHLFMTVMEPVIQESQVGYLRIVEVYWPDEELDERCAAFVQAFHRFWKQNVRLLHMRNNLADQHDPRALLHRIESARRAVHLLGAQMDGAAPEQWGPEYDLASVLYTGLERVVIIATDELLKAHYPNHIERRFGKATLKQQARLLALAIRDERAGNRRH